MTRHFDIREAGPRDTAALLALQRSLADETSFLLPEAHELPTEQVLGDHLRAVSAAENAAWFVAEEDAAAVGFLSLTGGKLARNRATAKIFLGIVKRRWGNGIGIGLLAAAEAWARRIEIRRLELTVHVDNVPACRLYRRMGFVTEGRMRATLTVDGMPVDEFVMGKLL